MSTKQGGAAIAAYDATNNSAYKLEGGFVAIPVYGVTTGKVEGGNLLPVYVNYQRLKDRWLVPSWSNLPHRDVWPIDCGPTPILWCSELRNFVSTLNILRTGRLPGATRYIQLCVRLTVDLRGGAECLSTATV